MTRHEHNTLVGKKNNEYFCLDDTFEHDDGMTGATGTILRPVTEKEHKERMERWDNADEYHPLHHVWKEQVASDDTTKGFQEWIDETPQHEKEEMESLRHSPAFLCRRSDG